MYSLYWPWVFALLPLPWLIKWLPRVKQDSVTTIQAPFLDDLFGSVGARLS